MLRHRVRMETLSRARKFRNTQAFPGTWQLQSESDNPLPDIFQSSSFVHRRLEAGFPVALIPRTDSYPIRLPETSSTNRRFPYAVVLMISPELHSRKIDGL